MKGKDRHKDRWLSGIRSPFERVFAHRNKRVRYRGLKKVQFQVGIRALVFNLGHHLVSAGSYRFLRQSSFASWENAAMV